MKENEIEANAFVYHRKWGVGRIIELEDNGQWLVIDFQDIPKHRITNEIALKSLSRLPNDGLEAISGKIQRLPMVGLIMRR